MKKKLGYNIRIKGEKVNYEVFKDYLGIAKRADDAGLYYLAFPEFFERMDRNRIHVIPYMSAIASHTEHVKFANDVLIVPLFHPKHIADIGASLDIISNGRFILGAGVGPNPKEYENFGIPFEERGKRTDEALDIIIKLWTEPAIAEYNGKFFKLRNVCSPPCVQKPHPPIWIGGASNAALRRTAQYGDEWATGINPPPDVLEEEWDVKERFDKLREYCKRFGRELVLGREPKQSREVGFNARIDCNINPDKEKAVEEASYFWVDVRKARTRGGGSIDYRLKYGAVGDAETVIEKVNQVFDAGAYLVTFYPMSTDSRTQWDRIEKEVLPSL